MIFKYIILCIYLFISLISHQNAAAQQISDHRDNLIEKIVFMRHAEKPLLGLGQINCRGFNRALALVNVLQKKYGIPNYIFAPNPSITLSEPFTHNYIRPLATIAPTAIYFDIPINTTFGYHQTSKLINELLDPKYHSALIFVAWEHIKLVETVKQMMSIFDTKVMIPAWPSHDYNSLYVMTIDWAKREATFTHEQENITNLNNRCPRMLDETNLTKTHQTTYNLELIQTIFLIPIAESDNDDNLNCKGFNRALALQHVLTNSNPYINKQIDIFIAPSTESVKPHPTTNSNGNKSNYGYTAGIMTLEPTVVCHGKSLSCPFGASSSTALAIHLLQYNFSNKTIVVSWPALQIPMLLKTLYQAAGGNGNDIRNNEPNHNLIYKLIITHKLNGEIKAATVSSFTDGLSPHNQCTF